MLQIPFMQRMKRLVQSEGFSRPQKKPLQKITDCALKWKGTNNFKKPKTSRDKVPSLFFLSQSAQFLRAFLLHINDFFAFSQNGAKCDIILLRAIRRYANNSVSRKLSSVKLDILVTILLAYFFKDKMFHHFS